MNFKSGEYGNIHIMEKEGWILEVKQMGQKTFFRKGDQLNFTEVSLKKKKIGEEKGYVK